MKSSQTSIINNILTMIFSAHQKEKRKQQTFISSFHLVVWIFAIRSPISDDQHRRMRKMYGETQEMISIVIKTTEGFLKTMDYIKSRDKAYMVKILLDQVIYQDLIDLCQKEERILEICLWDKTQMFNIKKPPVGQGLKLHTNALTFDEALSRAEKQVQKWVKSYKTFQNTHVLTDDFDRINKFRFILIAFINMKVSDFQGAFKQFRDFANKEVMNLETHLTNMLNEDKTKTYSLEVDKYLGIYGEYYLKAQQFMKAQTQSQKQEFYNYVMKFYQQDTFFYHIFNSNLRMIGQAGFNRKQLMLPFSHVYNSIRWLYLNQITKENPDPFYQQPQTVFRAERCKVSFINNLKRLLQQMRQSDERQNKVIKDHINLQYYHPFSTSRSAKVAADNFSFLPEFEKKQQKKDRGIKQDKSSQRDQNEMYIITRIHFSNNSRLHQIGNENFLHGLFKMTKKQNAKGMIQQQVLINSFNVFRLFDIRQMKIIELFTAEDLEIHKKQEQEQYKKNQGNQYRIASIKSRFYNQTITVIDLVFGPFHDEVLFQRNHFNLGKYEQKARQSYIYCINKIRKYNKFDYSDACFILSELEDCYKILKEKTAKQFQLSKQDGKNYFEQLAKICRMLGRVTEAKRYTNLSIQCHKQLQQVHLDNVYNTHYEKLYEMQMKAIQFYRECADLMDAHEGLNKALELLKSQHFSSSDAKLRESEVIMNLGINYYSRGKLDQSIEKFIECRVQLEKLLEICNLEPQLQCYFGSFIKNIFCKDEDKEERYCSYTRYGNQLRQIIREDKIRQYGSQSQLRNNSQKASQMLNLTQEAVKNRKQYFMKKQKYEKLIWNDIESNRVERMMYQDLEKQIKQCTSKMAKQNTQSEQYQILKEEFEHLNKRLKQMEVSNFQEEGAETYINQYIKKFTQREQKRREAQLKNKKESFLKVRQLKTVQQYISCARDIQRNIDELEKEGFVNQSSEILAQRKRLAEIRHKNQERKYALEQIKKILNLKLAEGQTRFYQFATACFTKGKIQFETYQYKQSIKSLQQSIQYFNSFWKTQMERAKELNRVQAEHKESDHNNEYQLVMMMKIKVELKKMEWEQSKKIQIIDREDKLKRIQDEIIGLYQIVKKRKQKQELSIRQLKCSINQIKIYYWIKKPENRANQHKIFRYLSQLIELNDLYEKGNNLKNILLFCDLATSYHRNDSFMARFVQLQYDLQLQKARIECANPSFEWIIARALYYVYKYKIRFDSSEQNRRKAQEYRENSIKLLQALSRDPNKRHLEIDLMDLIDERKADSELGSDKKNSFVGATSSTNPVKNRKQVFPATQFLQNSRDEIYRQK